ncbi:cytochrome P450 [Cristinia sonorae]|uniref:Cytochrome P450 n=1 Tax=Cristinia sonorae TaxID=1940300 RepID=A0A8K0UKE3_9AGAR|nr:cytochrome P450 [Cristinia sonorae]
MALIQAALYSLPSLYVIWTVYTWIYNTYFHPLARFPGPKLAAMSTMWKMWRYMIARDFIPRMVEVHSQYGNVVRVSPNELHFSDPDVYNELYNSHRRWPKYSLLYGPMTDGVSVWSILDYASAKKRRETLLSHFSRKSILELQHLINILCAAISRQHAAGQSSDFTHAFKCFSLDTITSVCFATSTDAINAPDFKSPVLLAMHSAVGILQTFIYFPVVRSIMGKIPPSMLFKMTTLLDGYNEIRQILAKQVRDILADPAILTAVPHPTIYHSLISPASQDPTVSLSFADLVDDAYVLVFAGVDTSSAAITTGVIHCIEDIRVYKALKQELKEAWPDLSNVPRYETLEKLPYLTAVVKESLRLSHGVTSPLPRVVPEEGGILGGHAIPGGTVVGMSCCFVHNNETVFEEAYKFKPERWLGGHGKDLEPYLVPFSKGTRSCVGMNLGYCEVYLCLANIFRRFEMQFDGVSAADYKWVDLYVPVPVGPDIRIFATPVSS